MALRSFSVNPRRIPQHPPIQLSPGASRFTLGMRMSVCAALLAFAGLLMASAAHSQSSGSWYYCDPAHAYYPYVRTCPAPWRAVAPYSYGPVQPQPVAPPVAQPAAPAGVAPAPAAASPAEPEPSAAYQQGQTDRQTWETWFDTLTGDYRAGAEYWAGQRSLPNPGSCTAVPSSSGAGWTAGCFAARQKLTSWDLRRKTEPEYRLGWNNPAPVAQMQQATPSPDRPWLGVRVQEVTPEIAESLGLPTAKGALVASLTPDGAAERAGIKQGDVIEAYDGRDILKTRDLRLAVGETQVGQTVNVTLWRNGQELTLAPTIVAMSNNPDTSPSVAPTAQAPIRALPPDQKTDASSSPVPRPAIPDRTTMPEYRLTTPSAPAPDAPTTTQRDGSSDGAIIILIAIMVALVAGYFLPAIIGARRHISTSGVLFVVNLFFGWTVIGWLFCMLWAATGATREQDAFFKNRTPRSNP